MPTIDQLTNKSKKKFVKSDYRPWNYMDEIEKESNGNQLEIKKEALNNQAEEATFIDQSRSQIGINQESIGNHSDINQVKVEKEKIIPKAPKVEIKKQNNEVKTIYTDQDLQETTLDTIFRLTGHQKKIFMFIFERCASRAMLSTGVIKGETLAEITATSIKMVKTSIQRLVGKNLVLRERGKTGRGGFYIFSLTEQVRNAAIEYKRMIGIEGQSEINKASIGNHKEVKKESFLNDKKVNLPEDWLKINIYPLEDIGFNLHHLMDIYETQLTDSKMVQESILHFAYGIEYESEKYKQYTDLLNVLIGRLRKGKPWFEKNYRSPQELAQVELLEAKKNQLERKKKVEEDAFKLAFSEWQEGLSESEIADITKKQGAGDIMPPAVKLSKYFRETIWSTQKRAYLIMEE